MTPGLLAELERDFGSENQLRQTNLADLLKHMEICATRLLHYQSAFNHTALARTPIAAISPEPPTSADMTQWLNPRTFDHEEAAYEQEEEEAFAEVLVTHLALELSVPPILLECRIGANGPPFSALFDTGVTVTLVDPSLIATHHLPSYLSEQHRVVALAGGAWGPALECR
ncbi:hypothetical protein C366_02137, partial [Cryptococcus neoformans Tu401-1]